MRVTLTDKAEEALIVLSVRERRNPRDQGGLLIEEKLREIGLLDSHDTKAITPERDR